MSKLIEIARTFKGMAEQPKNTFSDSTPLGKMLHAAGQKDGESWCSYYGEGCTVIAYIEHEVEIRKVFSANVVQCFKNCVVAGWPVLAYPIPGAIGFMQSFVSGVPQTTGHMTLIQSVNPDGSHLTFEGNSNESGARETDGGHVAQNTRRLGYKPDGLNYIGFVMPPFEEPYLRS